MNGLALANILADGVVFSLVLGAILLGAMYINPRTMLSSYPPETQALLPPLTGLEKRQRALVAILFWGVILAGLFYSNWKLAARSGEAAFLAMFLNTYFVFEIFNLFDLLIIDYLVLMVLKPPRLFIPGVERIAEQQTFAFHFKGFLKGSLYGIVLSLIVAGVCYIILVGRL